VGTGLDRRGLSSLATLTVNDGLGDHANKLVTIPSLTADHPRSRTSAGPPLANPSLAIDLVAVTRVVGYAAYS